MVIHTQASLLKKLAERIKSGDLTSADRAEHGTFVCLTQSTPLGMAYHQGLFEELSSDLRAILLNARKGDKFGPFKLVAIFHAWPEAKKKSPPVQAFDN